MTLTEELRLLVLFIYVDMCTSGRMCICHSLGQYVAQKRDFINMRFMNQYQYTLLELARIAS